MSENRQRFPFRPMEVAVILKSGKSKLADIFYETIMKKCVEPEKRMFCGKYTWVVHRYAIKNGKTLLETQMMENMTKNNILFSKIITENEKYK